MAAAAAGGGVGAGGGGAGAGGAGVGVGRAAGGAGAGAAAGGAGEATAGGGGVGAAAGGGAGAIARGAAGAAGGAGPGDQQWAQRGRRSARQRGPGAAGGGAGEAEAAAGEAGQRADQLLVAAGVRRGDSDPVYGSVFRDRVMVRDKQIRQLLLKFAERIKGRQAAGLKEEDYQTLCDKLQGADADQEQLILPLVQYHPVITQLEEGGQLRRVFSSCKKHQPILFSLGTSAPAVQLLRISSVRVLAPVIAA